MLGSARWIDEPTQDVVERGGLHRARHRVQQQLVQRMSAIEAALDHVMEKLLVVSLRLVSIDVGIPEIDEDRADVLVFVFDGSFRALLQQGQEAAAILGLVVGFAPELLLEHGEVVGDNRLHLEAGPWLVRLVHLAWGVILVDRWRAM